MSTNSIAAGMTTPVFAIFCSIASRASGTVPSRRWVDGAERIVGRLGFPGAGDGIEQCGLADVRQSDDSSSQHGCQLSAILSAISNQFSVLGSRFSVLGSQFSVLSSQFPAIGSRFSDISHQTSTIGYSQALSQVNRRERDR